MRLAAERVYQRIVAFQRRVATVADGGDHLVLETRFTRELGMDQPLVLTGPAPRGDQHRELDQLRRQLGLPAQVFAERLDAARELGVVDERDERAAHFAARTGGNFRRDLALRRRHLFAAELGKASHAGTVLRVIVNSPRGKSAGKARQCSARTSPNSCLRRCQWLPPSSLR